MKFDIKVGTASACPLFSADYKTNRLSIGTGIVQLIKGAGACLDLSSPSPLTQISICD